MGKINIRDLRPEYRWIWQDCSFDWNLRDGETFGFEKKEKEYAEYIIPSWQRNHVWTEEQQISYIEYCFMNPMGDGASSNIVIAQLATGGTKGEEFKVKVFLVDGLQRTTAVKRFLKGEFKIFGHYAEEYLLRGMVDFRVHMLDVNSEKEAIELYIALNGTGTPHTEEDLNKARVILEEECKKNN